MAIVIQVNRQSDKPEVYDDISGKIWSIEELEPIASDGDVNVQCIMGDVYNSGASYNPEQAAWWYEQASDRGHAEAQGRLGLMYIIGDGVDQNLSKAKVLLEKSAAQGCADGYFGLGGYYGLVKFDLVSAKYYLEKAVGGGHLYAKAILFTVLRMLDSDK